MIHTLGSRIIAQDLVLQSLLANSAIVGGIYTMGYDECLVLTNDLWKKQAGGVPQHCFLLATAMVPGQAPDPDDEELILLRVIGPAALPVESELVQVRSDAMREMVTAHGHEAAASSPAILDVLTRNEIQFSGIRAKVLGTFYESDRNGRPVLTFGSDVETFYSASRYKVYKPYAESLALIASYPELTSTEDQRADQDRRVSPRPVIGSVRYSSAVRRRQANVGVSIDTAVPVRVGVEDFIALKTAVFGMTRLGKSNTMKTIATEVAQYAAITNQRIGQLLFDPAGEYANVNVQDQTALSEIGPEFVTIFRYGASGEEAGIRALTTNFFNDTTIEVSWAIITTFLSPKKSSNYIESFLAANVVGPADSSDDRSEFERSRRRRSALYATLTKAGFQQPRNFVAGFAVNGKVLNEINSHLAGSNQPGFQTDSRGGISVNGDRLRVFWDAVLAVGSDPDVKKWLDDAGLQAILAMYQGSVGSGYRLLEQMRIYHSPGKTTDYAEEVLNELIAGKIVILDLSLGSEAVLQFCAERIINFIVEDAARRFKDGYDPHQIQVFIEEAHRLFDRERMKKLGEADPYVRLAKEAAKYKIGLIYATQEVSSVDPIILSNTSNWIVTHLNNHHEVRELSKYYDFADFSELTLKAEDVGFARIKTRSGRYIIPTQIALFDHERIQATRAACLAALASRS